MLIRRTPRLHTRQPDILFVRHATLVRGGSIPESGPLPVAPGLAVEIVSDSETEARLADKLTDYAAIGVQEGWVIRPEDRTVELLRLSPGNPDPVTTFTAADTLRSAVLPDLALPVAAFFRP